MYLRIRMQVSSYQKKWIANNKDKVRLNRQRSYYQKKQNDKLGAATTRNPIKNKEDYHHQYYLKNRNKIRARTHDYYQRNKDKIAEYGKTLQTRESR